MRRDLISVFGLTALFLCNVAWGQLDTVHWIPPLHSRDNGQINDHYLYLSTPATAPVTVNLYDGSGATFGDSPYTIQNGQPIAIEIGNGQVSGSKLMVSQSELNETLTNRGLKIEASAPIFCNARYRSSWQAEALTSKGTNAQGQTFRLGGMPITYQGGIRSYVFGIMATEDNVQVQISGYDNNVTFAGAPGVNDDALTFSLNEGESRVYSAYANSEANLAGVLGALVESTGNIVINVGNWCGSVGTTSSNQDIGADQIVPVPYLGTDHILVEGVGDPSQERGFILAHEAETEVFINGAPTPSATLQPGEWFMVPNNEYTGTPHSNCFIQTSKPAYVYQFLGGSPSQSTVGMNFIPPISCGMPNQVDEIPSIQNIGATAYTGGVFAITEAGANLTIDGIPQAGAVLVDGFPGWETYRILNLTGDITVESTGPVAVGLFGSSSDAGWSGYYSGFSLNTNAAFDAPDAVCWGNEAFVEFTGDTLGGGTLNWDFGELEANNLGDDLFEIAVDAPGEYTVYLDVQGDLCADTSVHVVTFYPPYSGSSVADACGEYTWNGMTYTSTGVYNDVLTSVTGCDSLVELTLDIMPIPDPMMADYTDDTLVYCPAPGSLLFGEQADPLYQIQWTYFPSGSSDSIALQDPTIAVPYVGPGLYQITYFTGPPCSFSAVGLIEVEIEECSIVIPNVFSPNEDGKNDRFRVSGLHNIEGVRMRIYNRWGNLLYSDLDFGRSAGWDPRLNAAEGTYYYTLEIPISTDELTVTNENGTEIIEGPTTATYQGHFTLVR